MKHIEFNFTASLTDLTLYLASTAAGPVISALATETEPGSGIYRAAFADSVTGDKTGWLKRGTRLVGGNGFVTMPATGAEAWLGARAGGQPAPLLLPTLSVVNTEPLPARKLTGYTGGGYQQKVPILDTNRQPIPMTGKTLQAVLRDSEGNLIGDPVTPTLEGTHIVVFNAPAAWHATAGDFSFCVWDLADTTLGEPRPWARGCYAVVFTATPVT